MPIALLLYATALPSCAPPPSEYPPSAAPPRFVPVQVATDLPAVDQGTPLHTSFPFRNEGGRPLRLERLRTVADCRASPHPRTLLPGESGTIELECDTDRVYGKLRRTVTVHTNDPEQPSLTIIARSEVRLDAVADPPAMYVGALRASGEFWRPIEILLGRSVRFLSVETEGRRLRARDEPLDGGRRGRAVRLSAAANAPAGPFETVVSVRTTSQRHPLLRVPVRGTIAR